MQNIYNFLNAIESVLAMLLPIAIAIAALVFIVGVIKWMANANNDEERKKGTKIIISGIVGLFVILSVFGIVRLVQETFNIDNENTVERGDIPQIPGINR